MAKPKQHPDGFEFFSPWLPAKQWEGMYIIALCSNSGRMYRWRFWRKHTREPGGKPFVLWTLDESSALVDPPADAKLLAECQTFDEPRKLTTPRDKAEATAVVLKRWGDIQRDAASAAKPKAGAT